MTVKWTTWKKRINPWKCTVFLDWMLFNIGLLNIFYGSVSSGKGKKNEDQQIGLHKTKQFSHRKGKDQQNEKVTY